MLDIFYTSSIKELSSNSPKSTKLFFSGILLLVLVYFLDIYIILENPSAVAWLQWGDQANQLKYYTKVFLSPITFEGHPSLQPLFLLKLVMTCTATVLIIAAISIKSEYKANPIFKRIPLIPKLDNPSSEINLRGFQPSFFDPNVSIVHYSTLIVLFPILLSLVFVSILFWDAQLFNELVQEDQIIENLSAVFYFVALFIFGYVILRLSGTKQFKDKLYFLLFAIFMSFGLFLMGMEEISWFQRVLEVETPEMFEGNLQNEMNFHNFATDTIEVTYYSLFFIFFMLLPFIREKTQLFPSSSIFSFFIPSRLLVLFSIISIAYTYDQWNIMFIQMSFFASVSILLLYTWEYKNHLSKSAVIGLITLVLLTTQLIFLFSGDKFGRLWDVTEYKELFIPLTFTLYAIEIALKSQRLKKRQDAVSKG